MCTLNKYAGMLFFHRFSVYFVKLEISSLRVMLQDRAVHLVSCNSFI